MIMYSTHKAAMIWAIRKPGGEAQHAYEQWNNYIARTSDHADQEDEYVFQDHLDSVPQMRGTYQFNPVKLDVFDGLYYLRKRTKRHSIHMFNRITLEVVK